MQQIDTVHALRLRMHQWRLANEAIAFVPTMGNLHAGHMALVEHAKRMAPHVVVSVFVNPLQFGPNEDFTRYPRTLSRDSALLRESGVDVVFVPAVEEVYPRPLAEITRVEVPGLSDILCGAVRPGHFVGVATVVAKLFNMVQPQLAVFGEKDFQQLLVIRRMVEDLSMPIEIVGISTVREMDGLALSSRNQYLSAFERQTAPQLHATLTWIAELLREGGVQLPTLEESATARLRDYGFAPDYVSIRRATDLALPQLPDDQDLVILAAARLGATRLIDNLRVSL